MARRLDYRMALRAKGIRSLPSYSKLRTEKKWNHNHVEITSRGTIVYEKETDNAVHQDRL